MPPSFGDPKYWEQRFHDDPDPYDWLIPASQLCDLVKEQIQLCPTPTPRLLHIGCGSSHLPFELKKTVETPDQIHNVDYAQAAIDLGVLKETQLDPPGTSPTQQMAWSQLDLLSTEAIRHLGKDKSIHYDLIIDKSTSDSICCTDDIAIPLPYHVHPFPPPASPWPGRVSIHPLTLLAVHLAAITPPDTGRWIAVSYNDDRFPFLSFNPRTRDAALLSEEIVARGFPDPRSFWTLERKYPVEGPPVETDSGDVVYRPDLQNWVYILVRTGESVN